jgi:quercetin dioxygenase-like cupin family protein
MTVIIQEINEVKKVSKPWGYEKWIANGSPDFKYALKEIFFKANHLTSIQFHEFKEETNFVQKGEGIFYYSLEIVDIEKFKNNGYSQEYLKQIIDNMQKKILKPGVVIHVKPGSIHRVESIKDLTIIEASTVELDDVFRLNDEWGRGHGKIDGEHQ